MLTVERSNFEARRQAPNRLTAVVACAALAGCVPAAFQATPATSTALVLAAAPVAGSAPAAAQRTIADETASLGAHIDWPARGGNHLVDELQKAVDTKCQVDRLGDPDHGVDETALHIRCNASAFFDLGKDVFRAPPTEWIRVGNLLSTALPEVERLEIAVAGSVDGVPIDPPPAPAPGYVACADLRREMSFGGDWLPFTATEAAAEKQAASTTSARSDETGPLHDRANRALSWCRAARTGSALLLGLRTSAAAVRAPLSLSLIGAGDAWWRSHRARCVRESSIGGPPVPDARNCASARRVDVYLRFVPRSTRPTPGCSPEGLSPRRLLACYEQNIARRRNRFMPADPSGAEVPFFAPVDPSVPLPAAGVDGDAGVLVHRLGSGPARLTRAFREVLLDSALGD